MLRSSNSAAHGRDWENDRRTSWSETSWMFRLHGLVARLCHIHPVTARRWGSTGVPDGPAAVLPARGRQSQRQDDRASVKNPIVQPWCVHNNGLARRLPQMRKSPRLNNSAAQAERYGLDRTAASRGLSPSGPHSPTMNQAEPETFHILSYYVESRMAAGGKSQ